MHTCTHCIYHASSHLVPYFHLPCILALTPPTCHGKRVGLPRTAYLYTPYVYTVYLFDDIPAKSTVHAPYIYGSGQPNKRGEECAIKDGACSAHAPCRMITCTTPPSTMQDDHHDMITCTMPPSTMQDDHHDMITCTMPPSTMQDDHHDMLTCTMPPSTMQDDHHDMITCTMPPSTMQDDHHDMITCTMPPSTMQDDHHDMITCTMPPSTMQDDHLYHATIYHASSHVHPLPATAGEVEVEERAIKNVAATLCPVEAILERVVLTSSGVMVACWQAIAGACVLCSLSTPFCAPFSDLLKGTQAAEKWAL